VRLGEGLVAHGQLAGEAMARTIEALSICAEKIARWKVVGQRHIATEACRRAGNCREFVGAVAAQTGLRLEIIPAVEEARLALLSCVPLIDRARRQGLLVDIGGGSTEVSWLEIAADGDVRIVDLISLPYGVVTMSEDAAGHLQGERLPLAAYRAMVDRVAGDLAEFDRQHQIGERLRAGSVQMIGTSGTVTTVAAINLGLRRYARSRVDGTMIARTAIERVSAQLAAQSLDELAQNPCIGAERADLVLAGCAILEGIMSRWPAAQVMVADRGLREGVLLELMRTRPAERSA
jgi:exopolyphosphatase / guanosine-5'-triphosphate,3'-diphosphate pyrophosphatase